MNIDLRWSVQDKNKLWISWSKAIKLENNSVKLDRAIFSGPVMADCFAIEESGYIKLDLTKHFIVHIPRPYIITLKWNKLLAQDNKRACFDYLILEDGNFGHLNKLKDRDSILLDCKGHTTEEEARGAYLSSYQAMIYDENSYPYDFSK